MAKSTRFMKVFLSFAAAALVSSLCAFSAFADETTPQDGETLITQPTTPEGETPDPTPDPAPTPDPEPTPDPVPAPDAAPATADDGAVAPQALAHTMAEWDALVPGNIRLKWYNGSPTWNSSMASPRTNVSDTLTEGVDYTRSYWFTDTLNNVDMADAWLESAEGMSNPGFVWEKVEGIGEYTGLVKYVRHNIRSLITITVEDATKLQGQDDPAPTITVDYHGNPYTLITADDVFVTREAGEEPGTYAYSIEFNFDGVKDRLQITVPEPIASSNGRVWIVGHESKGYIYLEFVPGTLTIEKTIPPTGDGSAGVLGLATAASLFFGGAAVLIARRIRREN